MHSNTRGFWRLKKGGVLLLLLVLVATGCMAQDSSEKQFRENRSFLGVSAGLCIPVGGFATTGESHMGARPGTTANLANFSYLITENLGISAQWFAGTNPVMLPAEQQPQEPDYTHWRRRGLLAGPLASVRLSKKLNLNLRQGFGFCVSHLPILKNRNLTRKSKLAFAHGAGLHLQLNPTPWLGIMAGADLLFTEADFALGGMNADILHKNISTLSPVISVGYRFR